MDEAQFDEALDRYLLAAGEFAKGNSKPGKAAV